jgi:hypothetical protein
LKNLKNMGRELRQRMPIISSQKPAYFDVSGENDLEIGSMSKLFDCDWDGLTYLSGELEYLKDFRCRDGAFSILVF